MKQTVLGVYDSYTDACSAQRALGEAGVAPADIAVYSMSVAAPVEKGPRVYAPGSGSAHHRMPVFEQLDQLFAQLFKQGEYPPETEDYKEFIRRGGAIVSADVSDTQVDLTRDVMRRAGAADIDERSSAWWRESSGMRDTSPGAAHSTGATSPAAAPERPERPEAQRTSFSAASHHTAGGMQQVTTRVREPGPTASVARGQGLVGDPLMGTPLDDETRRDDFPKDYDTRYAKSGAPDGQHARGYVVGRGQGQRDRRHESGWERFKGAVRHGWERVTRH